MWWKLALNPRIVTAYYSSPPALRGVEIYSIALNRDGPILELSVNLPAFPDRPSRRWESGANRAIAHLRFIDLRELMLDGWGTKNVGDLEIERDGDVIRFQFECEPFRIAGRAGFFDVTNISAFTGH